jgi:flavin reductase ActVB
MSQEQPLPVMPGRRLRRASSDGDIASAFRESMSYLAATVAMVTCEVDGRPWGLTISSCCAVSMKPPTILISLGEHTASAAAIREQGRFGTSILGQRGRQAAKAGAQPGVPKFVEKFCVAEDETGVLPAMPVVQGAIAHLDCEVASEITVADHVVIFGRVEDVIVFKGERPLLYYARGYATLDEGDPWWC